MPRQIASDLRRYFTRDIRDWHQGRLSSFELMELFGVTIVDDAEKRERTIKVEFAPEQGAVAKAMRNGGWSESQVIAAETHNEIARLRASFHASKKAPYKPFAFEDPALRAEKAKALDEALAMQSEVEDDIFGREED